MSARSVERRYCCTRLGQVHVRLVRGSTASLRRPLLCFHMSPWSGSYFEPLLHELGTDRLAVAADTPGYGNSDPLPDPPTIEDYAVAMADVLDELEIDKVDLLGDRTGAKIALELAVRQKQRVAGLVLVSPVVWTAAELAERREFAPETIRQDGSHLPSLWAISTALGMPGRTPDMLAESFAERLLQGDTAHLGRRAAARYREIDALAEIDAPILVLRPRDELWDLTARIKNHLRSPRSRIIDQPEWGLGFFQVKAPETASIVREFLDGIG